MKLLIFLQLQMDSILQIAKSAHFFNRLQLFSIRIQLQVLIRPYPSKIMTGVELVNEHSILIDKLTTLLAIYLLIQIEYLVMQVVEIVDIVS